MDYKFFLPHCCKCNSFGCTAAIRCGNACHGPHSDSLYSGSAHSQFNSPRLVTREAGFPNTRGALIGSNQLWRVNDSPYYRELHGKWYKTQTFIPRGQHVNQHGGVSCGGSALPMSRYDVVKFDEWIIWIMFGEYKSLTQLTGCRWMHAKINSS